MLTICLSEHESLYRWDGSGSVPDNLPYKAIPARLFEKLYQADKYLQKSHKDIFEWRRDSVKAKQWVGVIQVDHLRIEILPKVDAVMRRRAGGGEALSTGDIRSNVLTMLSIAGDVPLRLRDVANLSLDKAPLSECLIASFASQLEDQLLQGVVKSYVTARDNLGLLRGKLSISSHIKYNHSRRDLFICEYDEFTPDNPLNQVFKYCCSVLTGLTTVEKVSLKLQHCLMMLEDVSDVVVTKDDLDRVVFSRQNHRFESAFAFCRLVVLGQSPSISSGGHACFSLLFDMNQVFERFIAAFMKQHIPKSCQGVTVIPQANKKSIHLLKFQNSGRLLLKPDILIEKDKKAELVIDTKWKSLTTGTQSGRGGVNGGDLYQMHAYSQRFGVRHTVLLYPYIASESARDFDVINDEGKNSGKKICIRYIDLSRKLDQAGRDQLKQELVILVEELIAS